VQSCALRSPEGIEGRSEMTFDDVLDGLRRVMAEDQRAEALREGNGAGPSARKPWRVVWDGLAGIPIESHLLLMSAGKGKELKDESPLAALWAERRMAKDVLALGYEDNDFESRVFFDNFPAAKALDAQFVRLHLGRHSKR